jgi:hypothetical protein
MACAKQIVGKTLEDGIEIKSIEKDNPNWLDLFSEEL